MTEQRPALEEQVEELSRQVQELRQRVEQLSAYLDLPTAAGTRESTVGQAGSEPADASEELLGWVGRSALLQRLSTLCFLLVVALVLRTVTDNGLIDSRLGSLLGMGYAAILILIGWYKYARASLLAPVFAACGAVLMFTVVVEIHGRFAAIPSVPAYLLLMATGIGMAVISYRYAAAIPILLGALGMCLAGVTIDYPNPFFPYLAMVLFTANLLGYFAAQLRRCSWLRWIILLVTMAAFHMWAFKLAAALLNNQQPADVLALQWYLPVLALFTVSYIITALMGIVRSGATRISKFDLALPTVNVVWALLVAHYLISAWGGNVVMLGMVGVVAAAGNGGVAFWLAWRKMAGAPGTNSFVFAGSVLLALALPLATGNPLLALPLLSALALGLALLARQWQSGGIRVTSYLLQVYACVTLAQLLFENAATPSALLSAVAAGAMAGIGLVHYRWCRNQPPPEASVIFARFDRRDRSAVVMLMAALVNAFFLLRVIVYQGLLLLPGDVVNSFRCAQSVIINAAAAGLMLFAFVGRNRELRNIAILVTLVGAVKVFIYDLFGTHGVPLVISVFSFGVAAALESVALGRWQSQPGQEEGSADKSRK